MARLKGTQRQAEDNQKMAGEVGRREHDGRWPEFGILLCACCRGERVVSCEFSQASADLSAWEVHVWSTRAAPFAHVELSLGRMALSARRSGRPAFLFARLALWFFVETTNKKEECSPSLLFTTTPKRRQFHKKTPFAGPIIQLLKDPAEIMRSGHAYTCAAHAIDMFFWYSSQAWLKPPGSRRFALASICGRILAHKTPLQGTSSLVLNLFFTRDALV